MGGSSSHVTRPFGRLLLHRLHKQHYLCCVVTACVKESIMPGTIHPTRTFYFCHEILDAQGHPMTSCRCGLWPSLATSRRVNATVARTCRIRKHSTTICNQHVVQRWPRRSLCQGPAMCNRACLRCSSSTLNLITHTVEFLCHPHLPFFPGLVNLVKH